MRLVLGTALLALAGCGGGGGDGGGNGGGSAAGGSGGIQYTPSGVAGVRIPGCSVADDFTRTLGDPQERRFAAALQYRASQSCPAPSGFAPGTLGKMGGFISMDRADGLMRRDPWRENRMLRSRP